MRSSLAFRVDAKQLIRQWKHIIVRKHMLQHSIEGTMEKSQRVVPKALSELTGTAEPHHSTLLFQSDGSMQKATLQLSKTSVQSTRTHGRTNRGGHRLPRLRPQRIYTATITLSYDDSTPQTRTQVTPLPIMVCTRIRRFAWNY